MPGCSRVEYPASRLAGTADAAADCCWRCVCCQCDGAVLPLLLAVILLLLLLLLLVLPTLIAPLRVVTLLGAAIALNVAWSATVVAGLLVVAAVWPWCVVEAWCFR